MKKLKLYIETSVISYLDQPERGDKAVDSHRLWEKIKAEEFEAVISDVTVAEITKCDEYKRNTLFNYLGQIEYTAIEVVSNDKALKIASRFIDLGILRRTSHDDCQHIAAAITNGCDVIVSWNFSHIVNLKTISGVKAVTALEGYADILICTPSVIVGGDENDI
jgi:predicted nucleic acid-binding protein